ncbi:MAG: winged helix-turn-helix transcriptional regulator [Rhodobacteraceae bacterium]|nr:winged helix-turn-helix transcriptional regulator [Paracoccaceae bacterium]
MAADASHPHVPGQPLHDEGVPAEDMVNHAETASGFLKALSHEGRLMILCHLSTGEKTVTELETLLSSRQAAVSQQLARLRLEGLVSHRREGKAIYYSLSDERARRMLDLMYDMFCNAQNPPPLAGGKAG